MISENQNPSEVPTVEKKTGATKRNYKKKEPKTVEAVAVISKPKAKPRPKREKKKKKKEIFDNDLIDRNERSLLVCDDLAMVDLPKTEQRAISNLIRYESTHNNISVILINQNIYDLLPVVRRCSDYTILYKLSDIEFMKSLSRKFDIDISDLKFIFKNLITEKGDSLLIDEVCNKEYRLRKNIYTPITLKNKNIEN